VDEVDDQPRPRRWVVFWIVFAVVMLLGGVCFVLPAVFR
jgi:hypothetical protein